MNEQAARELVKVLSQPREAEHSEAFDRAFELTRTYAGSGNAQAAAIPVLFEKLFELFVTGSPQ
jgi:hypothetical protein